MPESLHVLEIVAVHVELVCFTIGTALCMLAYREYRGAPWGSVIAGLTVFSASFLGWVFAYDFALHANVRLVFSAVLWFLASLGLAYAAVQYYRIATMQRVIR